MEKNIKGLIQESFEEWADLEKKEAELEKEKQNRARKDQLIISKYCASHKKADMFHIAELLIKYDGMPKGDRDIVIIFKEKYPDDISLSELNDFLDVQDLYRDYLESGGENDD